MAEPQVATATLIQIARHANHRLLEVERVRDHCALSYESVQRLTQPTETEDGHRAPGLKIDLPVVPKHRE